MIRVGVIVLLFGLAGAAASGLAGLFYQPPDSWADGWGIVLFDWMMAVLVAGFGVVGLVGLLLILLGGAFRWWRNKSGKQ